MIYVRRLVPIDFHFLSIIYKHLKGKHRLQCTVRKTVKEYKNGNTYAWKYVY